MDLTALFDAIGEPATAALGALVIGAIFGVAAQRSRFCLRSAVIDLAGTGAGGARWQRLAVWLLAFGAAIAATQALLLAGSLEVDTVRQLTSARSLSGVLIGGLLFGIGMNLTRGCVSRLTVLSANGNLRAVFSIAVFAAFAFATFDGPLTPLRQSLLGIWTLGPSADLGLLSALGQGPLAGILLAIMLVGAALAFALRSRTAPGMLVAAAAVGVTVALGWRFTYMLSGQVFEPVVIESISFVRPFIDWVDLAMAEFPLKETGFGTGLLAGVLAGSFLSGLVVRELRIEWFNSASGAGRYAAGAALMGFGGVLAGGCSVGAGLTGGALFAVTPLLALAAMAAGSMATEFALRAGSRTGPSGRARAVPAK